MTFRKALKAFFGARPPVEKGAAKEKRAKKRRSAANAGSPLKGPSFGMRGPKNSYGFKSGPGF
jgi:hypothetical protein